MITGISKRQHLARNLTDLPSISADKTEFSVDDSTINAQTEKMLIGSNHTRQVTSASLSGVMISPCKKYTLRAQSSL